MKRVTLFILAFAMSIFFLQSCQKEELDRINQQFDLEETKKEPLEIDDFSDIEAFKIDFLEEEDVSFRNSRRLLYDHTATLDPTLLNLFNQTTKPRVTPAHDGAITDCGFRTGKRKSKKKKSSA